MPPLLVSHSVHCHLIHFFFLHHFLKQLWLMKNGGPFISSVKFTIVGCIHETKG